MSMHKRLGLICFEIKLRRFILQLIMQPLFPNFKKLTLEDKEDYNRLVSRYTPFSDISFTTLHIWWDLDQKLYFSILNDNLVLNYSQPFYLANAGWSLIGDNQVDDSLRVLFDYLGQHQRKQRLVHVPEFVVEKIGDKSHLEITEEADMHEYIVDASALANLEGSDLSRIRRKVGRFLRETEDDALELRPLELDSPANEQLILESVAGWEVKYPKANDLERTENDAIKACLKHHQVLDTQNLCLFINGKLHGIVLFHKSHDDQYCIINHLKVDYTTPFIFDYLTNQVAIRAVKDGVPHLNMEMDLGIEGLRQHKQGLRPVAMLKKYALNFRQS